jgi:processing peptidase subunit alpha
MASSLASVGAKRAVKNVLNNVPVRALSALATQSAQVRYDSAAPADSPSLIAKLLDSRPKVPLSDAWPNLPALETPTENAEEGKVSITTLDNGMRVASTPSSSPIAHVGVFIDAGSRYEIPQNAGIHHFIEQMAFKSTLNRSDFRLVREMGKLGANLTCAASREHMIYSADMLQQYTPEVFGTIADVIQRNYFDPLEVQDTARAYCKNNEDRAKTADIIVMESIHAAAYANNTLGNPLYAPTQNLPLYHSESLQNHAAYYFTPKKMVVAGVGVDHKEMVDLTNELFNDLGPDHDVPKEAATYTGGEVRMHAEPADGLVHFALAFETASWHDADLVPMCVLQMMMGGGGAFSAGGPGKGMYSRLYENVLNQHAWVETASSFNSIFSDSSLSGFYGMCAPNDAGALAEVLVVEAKKMAGPVDSVELDRAKKQLKSAVYMQLESRALQLEDIGRQVVTYGEVKSPDAIASQIDQVTEADIQGVAAKMLKTQPAIAAYGNLSYLPRYDVIANALQH